jgi:hypothetical protein
MRPCSNDDNDELLFGKLIMTSERDESTSFGSTSGDQDGWAVNPMEMEPGTFEIEMDGDESDFAHKITTSDPYDMIIVTGKDRSRYLRHPIRFKLLMVAALALICISLIVVSINTQKSKRKEKTSSSLTTDSLPDEDNTNVSNKPDSSDDLFISDDPGRPNEEEFTDAAGAELSNVFFAPLSQLDPVSDLDLPNVLRPAASRPSSRLDPLRATTPDQALPTNAWYQNLLLLRDDESPTSNHRAYTMPYIVDVVGTIPGMRVHHSTVDTSADQFIVSTVESSAVTLGAAPPSGEGDSLAEKGYTVLAATDLGVTLEWTYNKMVSSFVRGMPYATMVYPNNSPDNNNDNILPTIYAETKTSSPLLLDGGTITVPCTEGSPFEVNSEIELLFETGLTWLVFVSHPATFQCKETVGGAFMLQAVDILEEDVEEDYPFTLRLAMVFAGEDDTERSGTAGEEYKEILRSHSNVYPGKATNVDHKMGDDNGDQAALIFDWDPQPMNGNATSELIMYAMPHHQDKLSGIGQFCAPVLLGTVCLMEGSAWAIGEELPPISFAAPRLPEAAMIPDLAVAVINDLSYRIPQNFFEGAGDTYFSGKALGKLSRIILIAEELLETCTRRRQRMMVRSLLASDEITEACSQSSLPSRLAMDEALENLRGGVEVWLNGNAQAPFLYDSAWGGLVSCGCDYASGSCRNVYPNCPGLSDQGLNFGAGKRSGSRLNLRQLSFS